jgi:uncharacterized protein YecE (DUF72 family)
VRQKKLLELVKWDKYRVKREEAQDEFIWTVKQQRRVTNLVVLIKVFALMRRAKQIQAEFRFLRKRQMVHSLVALQFFHKY